MSYQPPAALIERERARVIIGALTVMFLAALDQTIVAPALPTIGASLGGGLWLSWVVSAYFLTSTALTPLCGKLADLKGRRPVLYSSIVVFLVGSVICAMAPSMAVLIAGRAIQGIGGGGLVASAQTIIGDVAPPKERARYTVYISALWAIASVAGPVVGGVLAQHAHWSMIFWINLPIGVIAYFMCSRALTKLQDVRRNHALDILGAFLVTAAAALLLLGLTWAGSAYPWKSPVIWGLIGASVLLFGLFGWYQRQPEEPLLPPRVLADPVVRNACAAAFFCTASQIGLSVYLPVYLQLVEGYGAAAAGLVLVALLMGGVLGSNLAGVRMHKSPRYKRVAVSGAVVCPIALITLGVLAGTAPFIVVALVGIAGFCFGTVFPVVFLSVQNAAESRDLGVATATVTFLRSLGAVFGLALLSAIAGTVGITSHLGAEANSLAESSRTTVVEGFRWIFYAAGLSQVLALIFLLLMEEKPLRGDAPQTQAD